MPTYDYHCPSCNATYELRQGFDAETTHTCEECGKGIAKRVLHAPPVVFKGSGWYVTDSRNRSSATSESDSAPPGTETTSEAAADAPASPAPASTVEATPAS